VNEGDLPSLPPSAGGTDKGTTTYSRRNLPSPSSVSFPSRLRHNLPMVSLCLPLTWALVATVDAPQPGELAAHRDGPYVAIADVRSREAKLYDGRGEFVRTVEGPNAPNLYSSTLWTGISNQVAMAVDGRITLMKNSPDYLPRFRWQPPHTLEIDVYRVPLRKDHLGRSFLIAPFGSPEPELSWDGDAAYISSYNSVEVASMPTGRRRRVKTQTTYPDLWARIGKVHALPGNKVATIADFVRKGDTLHRMVRVPRVPVIGHEMDGMPNRYYYLSIMDLSTGIVEPVAGLTVQYDGLDSPPRFSSIVFNRGRSIAVQIEDKFHIFENLGG
jgi:hypothetical protein